MAAESRCLWLPLQQGYTLFCFLLLCQSSLTVKSTSFHVQTQDSWLWADCREDTIPITRYGLGESCCSVSDSPHSWNDHRRPFFLPMCWILLQFLDLMLICYIGSADMVWANSLICGLTLHISWVVVDNIKELEVTDCNSQTMEFWQRVHESTWSSVYHTHESKHMYFHFANVLRCSMIKKMKTYWMHSKTMYLPNQKMLKAWGHAGIHE